MLAPFPGTGCASAAATTACASSPTTGRATTPTVPSPRPRPSTATRSTSIAVEWEDRFNRYLGDIQERMQKGEASADEAHQLTNLERIVLVYDLMMKTVIEQTGTWPDREATNAAGLLDGLIRRVDAATQHGRNESGTPWKRPPMTETWNVSGPTGPSAGSGGTTSDTGV